jgi:hypothetical protein
MPTSKNTLPSLNEVALNDGPGPTGPRAPASEVQLWGRILGISIIVVAVGGFVWFFIVRPKRSYRPNYQKFVITRILPAPAQVQTQDMFTPPLKRTYIDGWGLKVFFVTKEEGPPDEKMPPPKVLLEAFERYDAEPAPVRYKEIDQARAQLEQDVAEFNTPPQLRIIVFADNTTGDQLGVALVEQWYERLGLEGWLGKGWSVWLRFHRISDRATTLFDPPAIELPPKADMAQLKPEILKSMTKVFAPTNSPYSVIATGMFNALQEDARVKPIDGHTRILLFSDLHENDPNTLSFEKPPLADLNYLRTQIGDPARRRDLEDHMQSVLKCRPFSGAHVDVFFPPNQDQLRSSRMLVLFQLWSELFVSHGAASDVGEHF